MPWTSLQQKQDRHHDQWRQRHKNAGQSPRARCVRWHECVELLLNAIHQIERQASDADQNANDPQANEMTG